MGDEDKLTPVQEFVRTAIEEAMAGFPPGFRFASPIEFKMSVVSSREGGGGLKAYVVDIGGKFEAQEVKQVTFSVTNAEDPDAHIRDAQKKMLKDMGF
jgi:hypothetical protein